METKVRVAISGEVFDDHSDSHTLFSYGGHFFDRTLTQSAALRQPPPGPGVCWRDGDQIVINTKDNFRRPERFDLGAFLKRAGEPVQRENANWIKII